MAHSRFLRIIGFSDDLLATLLKFYRPPCHPFITLVQQVEIREVVFGIRVHLRLFAASLVFRSGRLFHVVDHEQFYRHPFRDNL